MTAATRTSDTPLDAAALARLEALLRRRFRTVETDVTVNGTVVHMLHPADADDLISEADYVKDERLPYWADLWPSAHALAGWIEGMEGRGRTLVELGCGSGLVTCCAARAGFDVTATDYYDDALRFTAVNAHHAAGRAVRTRHVDWTAMPEDLGRFDVVIASDVLYEPRYAGLVAGAIERTLTPGGTAWVADPGRLAAPAFEHEARALGLTVELAARVPFIQGSIRQTIDIRTLRRQ